MLKVRLRDYVGAHADLKQLVELYPETELSDRACLYLADATMKAGLYEEATGLYRKVYNLGLSVESQTQSALGSGPVPVRDQAEYEEAAKWLSRYTTLARDQSRPEFSAACLLLGKTYLALHKPQQAQAALNLALKGELSHQQHVETIAVLVKTYLEQGLCLEALEHAGEHRRMAVVAAGGRRAGPAAGAGASRSIGLADKATALLAGEEPVPVQPRAAGESGAGSWRSCQIASGDLESARKTLGDVFAAVEPGPLADQIGRELARVCLRLGQTAQAMSVCATAGTARGPNTNPRGGLPATRNPALRARADRLREQSILALLADAYRKQGKLRPGDGRDAEPLRGRRRPQCRSLMRNN